MRQKPSASLCGMLAVAMMIGTAAPAMSAPLKLPQAVEATPNIIKVQDRRFDRDRDFRYRDDRRRGWDNDRFERRGDGVYWRGHRGFRERRPGYREYNGWWFPPAAFALGAIIGGAMSQGQQARPAGNAHVQWCYNRYRSYRPSDNTYQPYNGPRRQCVSPYS
ncbi:BA14K family protein [Chelativorans sp. J32]|uniref:BA14K family protein n=1 Tax=Chelativorans sp. J32 TaxID=935840 RepID=UPI0004891538|nr:BA14K family protein [Chelativorans sp. J32]